MKIINWFKSLFAPKKYTLGPEVFQCRSWLDRQVQDALWKQHKEIMSSNPCK